jgi:hypothetical protein
MVHDLVVALERNPQTAWLVIMSRVLASILAGFMEFLDNERAFVHFGTTSVLMFFGMKLAWPGSTFGSSPEGYHWFMSHWPFSETGWAAMLICIALLSYSALLVYPRKDRKLVDGRPTLCFSEVYQILCGGVLLSAHTNLAWGFFHGNPLGTAFVTYSIVAVFSAWVIYRIHRRGGIWA